MSTVIASETANAFALSDESVTVTIGPDMTGRPVVTLTERGSPEHRFSGDEVAVEESRTGTWYTVWTATFPGRPESYSVLTPTVLLRPGTPEPVETLAVHTEWPPHVRQTADEDTRHGQQAHYRALTLRGDASLHRT